MINVCVIQYLCNKENHNLQLLMFSNFSCPECSFYSIYCVHYDRCERVCFSKALAAASATDPESKADDELVLAMSAQHCQHNMTLIYCCSNQPDADKSAKIRQQEEHLRVVQLERSLYNTIVKAAKDTAATHGLRQLSANKPCSRSIVMHYSFDCAQQVHLPSNPCSLDRCTFSYQGSVACLVCAAKPYQNRSTSSSTRPTLGQRGRMLSFCSSTSSSQGMAWERLMPACTVTTARGRTRIATCCGTVPGEC